MKKKHKLSTLVFGIIIAIVALANTSSYADKMDTEEVTGLKISEAEMVEIIERVLDETGTVKEREKCLKIYNSKSQLVYECRDKSDERLKLLLRRSDLVLQTDSSSYYLLGD